MVIIKNKWRGSFTVEATVIVSFVCMLIALIVMLGFYVHDCAVMKSTANELAIKASMWGSRYVSPVINEVDYESMKEEIQIEMSSVEDIGYEWLGRRLLYGKVKSVHIFRGILEENVRVKICVSFKIWNFEFAQNTQSDAIWIDSRELPRMNKETGGEE